MLEKAVVIVLEKGRMGRREDNVYTRRKMWKIIKKIE